MRPHLLIGFAVASIIPLISACAAQPAERADGPDAANKVEALLGAECRDDAGCDGWEYCNTIVCVTTPCPSIGHCENVRRWYDNEGADIPDADRAGVTRSIVVDRPESTVTRAFVSVNIDHTWRGDLRVVLASPRGTTHVLHDRQGGGEDDLNLGVDVTRIFEGESAVGAWRLQVADTARADVGRLLTWSIELDYAEATPGPEPEPGRDIWAEVVVPNIESAHDYESDTDQTWDLGPFSGGAARSRIRFARLETESGYDFVEILDTDNGEVLDRFTGDLGAFTTRDYETGNLAIRLVSDYSVTAWGFEMAEVQVFGLGCLDDDDCGSGYQCPNELVRCIRFPCFLTCQPATQGGEGEGCAGNGDCRDDLYCGADGFCRADGSCPGGDVTECSMPGNAWVHIMCAGYATCGGGLCGWDCGPMPGCVEGEITDDGCNTCQCSGGRWLCTERYCPPVAAEGERCGEGVICDAGLTCDMGRGSAATCSSAQDGICRTEGPRICTREFAPVCACNGQTFSNECNRIGNAPFAHEGECALSFAIPDADAAGITQYIDVAAPTGGRTYSVTVRIEHSWRSDLVVWLEDPDGRRQVISNRSGGSADDLDFTGSFDVGASGGLGRYTLHVSDHASQDVGVLRFFNVSVR